MLILLEPIMTLLSPFRPAFQQQTQGFSKVIINSVVRGTSGDLVAFCETHSREAMIAYNESNRPFGT